MTVLTPQPNASVYVGFDGRQKLALRYTVAKGVTYGIQEFDPSTGGWRDSGGFVQHGNGQTTYNLEIDLDNGLLSRLVKP